MSLNSLKSKQYWKQKIKSQLEKKQFKKQIFGQHYNYQAIKMNRNKKYFNEQVKIMQIQRSNRILLQKIKKISERSKPKYTLTPLNLNTNVAMNYYGRVHTQGQKSHLTSKHNQNEDERLNQQNYKFHVNKNNHQNIQRSQTQHQLLNQIKYNTTKLKKQRYNSNNHDTSIHNILDKTRVKNKQTLNYKRKSKQIMQMEQFIRINQNKTTTHKKNKQCDPQQLFDTDSHIITLYRGKRILQNIAFSITIFIQDKTYTIMSETKISKQKIQIPLQNYKILLKQELKNDHLNIFNLLKVNADNRLSFIGTKKIQVDVIEKQQLVLPAIDGKNRKETIVNQMQLD